jgi:hypothetical protein
LFFFKLNNGVIYPELGKKLKFGLYEIETKNEFEFKNDLHCFKRRKIKINMGELFRIVYQFSYLTEWSLCYMLPKGINMNDLKNVKYFFDNINNKYKFNFTTSNGNFLNNIALFLDKTNELIRNMIKLDNDINKKYNICLVSKY